MQSQPNARPLTRLSARERFQIASRARDRCYSFTNVHFQSSAHPTGIGLGMEERQHLRSVLDLLDALDGVPTEGEGVANTIRAVADEWCMSGIRDAAENLAGEPEQWAGPGEVVTPEEWAKMRSEWQAEIEGDLHALKACSRALELLGGWAERAFHDARERTGL